MRFSIQLMLFVVALTGIGVSYFVNQHEIDSINEKLPALRETGRVLVVNDPSQLIAVKQYPERFGQKLWKIHLPKGKEYTISVAFESIDSEGISDPQVAIPIESGIGDVSFWFSAKKDQGDKFLIAINGQVKKTLDIPWKSSRSDSLPWFDGLDFMAFGINQTKGGSEALELLRFRCHQNRKLATVPGDGILVWIQATDQVDPQQ